MTRNLLQVSLLGILLSTSAAAQNYLGYLDAADCSSISGWAEDFNNPGTAINVEIWDGSTYVTTTAANLYRSDVGYHAFTISTPASLKNNQYHYIYVKYSGTNLYLYNSDRPLYCTATSNGYQYYYSDTFPSINVAAWTQNGNVSTGTGGLTNASTNDYGSLISKAATPAGGTRYEVKATLALTQAGGNYDLYLEASSDALYGSTSSGSYYVVEVQSLSYNGNGSYNATLGLNKRVSGVITSLGTTNMSVHNGSVIRAVYANANQIIVYSDGAVALYAVDSSVPNGQPGVGVRSVPSGNGISRVDLGPFDTVAPTAVSAQLISTSSFPTRVDIHSAGTVDDPNGTGIAFYQLWRSGAYVGTYPTPNFTDLSVSADNPYSYSLIAFDYHLNAATTAFTVRTPPANAIDARQVGVRPTGSYWGGAGEQIDMRSGNLNYTIPLLKAQGRGGWGVGFNLSYNSQNWRQDPANTWQLGQEVGYGYGWRLQAGSVTPVYRDYYTVDHYVFMDSTSAEYRLDQNNGSGVWTSKEGIYLSFDSNAGRLYFTDGSFWTFGSISGGSEQDAGVMYPTLMQDTNGNQVLINYTAGGGLGWLNSSSRIQNIEDVRGNGQPDYTFTYNYQNAIPRLASITNTIGTSEKFTFSYNNPSALVSPWNAQSNFGTINLLAGVTVTNLNLTTSFSYDNSGVQYFGANAGTGELTQVTTPYGGHLRWVYQANTLAGSRAFREVQSRFLLQSSGGSETGVSIYRDSGDTNRSVHLYANFFDWSGGSNKVWWFETNTALFNAALQTAYEERNYPTGTALFHQDFTWAQTPTSANPYINSTLTTLDPGQSYQAQKKTTQTLDQYGNLTNMQLYDFGNLSTPARSYTNQYLTDTNYTSRYIRNRLTLSYTGATTLAQNSYDSYIGCSSALAGQGWHEHDDTNYGPSFIYRGNPTSITTPAGSKCLSYDAAGNTIGTTQDGVTTTLTMGTYGAVPSAITTGSLATTLNWNSFLGLTSTTGPNGDSAGIAYDPNTGRPQSATSPYGAVTTFSYNDNPTPPAPPSKTATTNGHWVRSSMDGFGRTIKTETGYSSTTVSTVDTIYLPCGCSPLGKMTKTSQPYAPGGTLYWTTNTYDGSGRTVSTQAPDGSSTTTYVYQGNTVTVTDPAGKWKKFTMDAFGNLTSVLEPDPTYTTVTTNYSYDVMNHLTQVSMPRGGGSPQVRSFNYTYSNGVTVPYMLSSTNPETGTVSYTYDTNGVLLTKTDAKNQVFTYGYDGYKRMTSITVDGNVIRNFYYDTNPLDGTFSQYTQGRLTAVLHAPFVAVPGTPQISHRFAEMYSYSQAGQPIKKRLQANENVYYDQTHNHTGTINLDAIYTYDNEGKMTSVNYPTTYGVDGDNNLIPSPGPTYTYSFDNMHRPVGLTDQNSYTAVNGVTYGAANQLLTMNYFGASETRTYNSMLQMTRLSIPGQVDITYTFPSATTNNGKISSQTDNISGETVSYLYDSLNRLSAASGSGWNQNFGYDGFGNLVSKTGTNSPALSVAIDATTNRVVGQSYDANGNQQTSPTMSGYLYYDPENRLLSAPGVQYAYDAQNKRIWKGTFDGNGYLTGQQLYFYGVDGQKLGTYYLRDDYGQNRQTVLWDPTPTLSVFFDGKRVAVDGAAFVPDRLGSKGKYYPYGEERNSPPMGNDQVKFASYTRDSATGLDYADQRYYVNNFARFMSADAYKASAGQGDPSSWNRYSYVGGDPINYVDPSGEFRKVPDIFRNPALNLSVFCDFLGRCYEASGPADDSGAGGLTQTGPPGTGGGGVTYANAESELNAARVTLIARTAFSDDCRAGLAKLGVTPEALRDSALTMGFANGFTANINIAAAYSDPLVGNADQFKWDKIYGSLLPDSQQHVPVSYLFLFNPGLHAWTPYSGHTIYFDAGRVDITSPSQNQGFLMHEFLHGVYGLDDEWIQEKLGITKDAKNTINITNWFRDNCVNGVGNH
jgi:RHS repeat-associated protein